MVAPILGALRDDREAALRDPAVLRLLVRERARLARALAASAPRMPRLSSADVMLLRALADLHDSPLEVVLDGVAEPGARVRAARLRFADGGRLRVDVGTAVVDEWGRLEFLETSAAVATPAPAPLAMAG